MLEIRKTTVSFDEKDLMELEKIVTDGDERETLRFVKKFIYDRILYSQQSTSLISALPIPCSTARFC